VKFRISTDARWNWTAARLWW